MKKNKFVLITGACGYVGFQTSIFFLKKGYSVIGVDKNLNIKRKIQNQSIKYYKSDFANKRILEKIFSNNLIIAVIHLAALTNVKDSLKNKKKYLKNNYLKTIILFNYCNEYKVKAFLFSSSAAVYSYGSGQIYTKPKNIYGITKLKSESYIKKNSKILNYSILRYFNIYGVDLFNKNFQSTNNSFFSNIQKIKSKKSIDLFYTEINKKKYFPSRSFIHVKDIAEINFKSVMYNINKKKNLLMNVGSEKSYKINYIIKIVKKILKTNFNVNLVKSNFQNEILHSKNFKLNLKNKIKYKLKYKNLSKNIKEILR